VSGERFRGFFHARAQKTPVSDEASGLGVSVGGSEWMFTPELKSGAVKVVLADRSLPPAELWAVFPTGRQASAKARAFVGFMEPLGAIPGHRQRMVGSAESRRSHGTAPKSPTRRDGA
jgi:hypothetical protein